MFLLTLSALAQVVDNPEPAGKIKPAGEKFEVAPDTLSATKAAVADDANQEIIKKGLSFGPLPIIAYDTDKGLQYGALLNIYNFGDGSWYPNPKSQWYLEASFYTKGSKKFTINYDNRSLINKVRIVAAAELSDDTALDFYGFNGYQSYYDPSLPTAYYRFGRIVPYFKVDFKGEIIKHFYWQAGYHFKYFKTSSFTSETLTHPTTGVVGGLTLFDWYKMAGVIYDEEADGGFVSSIRTGLVWDSRDQEAAPSKGIWAEANIEYAPKALGTSTEYAKYSGTFRHYIPLAKDKLVFAYRLNAEGFIGDPPFYVLPYTSYIGQGYDRDGFGGYRTIRGIMRNRLQGKLVGAYNTELRWKFVNFRAFNQNISLGLSAFCDGGMVLVKYREDLMGNLRDASIVGPTIRDYVKEPMAIADVPGYTFGYNSGFQGKETLHVSAGAGFRFIMNRNFIIAVEYGRSFNVQDNGKMGSLYINTGYLF